MGVRCLEESLLQTLHQAAPRFLESSPIGRGNRSRFQDAAESSVRPSRSFLGTEEVGNGGRFLYPGIAAISGSGSGSAGGRCSNASKFVGSACRNENFISSPARYKVENGRIYRLPLATKDVPKSEQLANCFQAFMPLASTFLLRNGSRRERPAQSLVNQPLGHHNQHYNRPQHQHHRHHLHLPRDTNNNSDGSSSCSNSNNGGINAGICGDERGLHRRPWFGSLTHVDSGGRHGRVIPTETSTAPFVHSPYIGRRPESIQSPEHPVVRQEARSTRVWECLKEDARVSVAEDDFDNYVEWLTLSRAQCFYGNLPKAGQQRKTEPPATKQVYHHHNNSSNINNIHNNHYHHHHHNHHQWQSHRHHHQHRNDTQHHRNHQRYDNPRPIDASGRRSSCSNPTNSDFEGRHLPPRREFSLLRDSDESDNDYVDIDALDLTLSRAIDDDDPRNQRQQAATASDDFKRAKESNRHAGRKSLRKKQLLRERARKLAEERNSRNSGRQDPSAIPSSKCKTQTSRKNVDKRRSRQKLMIPTDAKAHESAIHFSAGQEGEEEEEECGFLESSQTENFYSSLAGYESTEGSFVHERALAEMNSRGEDSVLFVRAKHQPSMTSV